MKKTVVDVMTGEVSVVDLTPEELEVVENAQPPEEVVPDSISYRQFFQQLGIDKLITEAEALEAVGPRVIPQALNSLIESLPKNQRFNSRMLVRGATEFRRSHPVASLLGSLYGLDEAGIDRIWINASKLT